jgi:hypothetical protein
MKVMEKEIKDKIDGGLEELSGTMRLQLGNFNHTVNEHAKLVHELEKKVVRVLKELPAKAEKDEERFAYIEERITSVNDKISKRIDQLIEDNFRIPDIELDPSLKPLSFREFMTGNLSSLAKSVKQINHKLDHDYTTK